LKRFSALQTTVQRNFGRTQSHRWATFSPLRTCLSQSNPQSPAQAFARGKVFKPAAKVANQRLAFSGSSQDLDEGSLQNMAWHSSR
jgi:hypothetical protein